MNLQSKKSDIECPKCKKTLGLTLGQIKPSEVKCPHCGVTIKLTGDNLAKEIKKIDDIFKNFGK